MTITWVTLLLHTLMLLWLLHHQELLPTSDSNLATSLMKLFGMLMHEHCQDDKQARENKNLKNWIVVSSAFSGRAVPVCCSG